MKESFSTSVGRVEVLVDEQSRTVSAYRFDAEGRPVAAAMESWDYIDLADLLIRQAGVPIWEANEIASGVKARLEMGDQPPLAHEAPSDFRRARERRSSLENAGVPLRSVAVLLDAVVVFLPAGIIVGLLSGGGYTETGNGYANAGIDVAGRALFFGLRLAVIGLCVATGAPMGPG